MRPPICEVCGRGAIATVSFSDYEPLPDGMVGHPRGVGWFCRWHLKPARRLSRRTLGQAVRRLRALTVLVLSLLLIALLAVGVAIAALGAG